ncbi:MAG: ABC transporter permease [Bacillota bacterium]
MKYRTFIVWAVIILLWFIFTLPAFDFVNPRLFPSPYRVLLAFVDVIRNGYSQISFLSHLSASFGRLFLSIFIAILLAVPIGLISGYIRKVEVVISSIVEFVRPLPPLAYYMLLILWLGIGNTSKVVLLFIAAFSPIFIACVQAVKQVRKNYILQAKTLGASNLQLFTNVVLPSALPNIFTGIRTATGVAYTTLVSAEIIAASSGVGWMILDASNYLKSDIIFVGIIVIGLSAVLLDKFLQYMENKVVFWKGKT